MGPVSSVAWKARCPGCGRIAAWSVRTQSPQPPDYQITCTRCGPPVAPPG